MFDMTGTIHGVLKLQNAKKRIKDLVTYLDVVIKIRKIGRHETLNLRQRLGFADGFFHGRLGALLVKRLIDHAYSFCNHFDDSLTKVLGLMVQNLQTAGPIQVDAKTVSEWCVFMDALLGAAFWWSWRCSILTIRYLRSLVLYQCEMLGAREKETIIHELDLLAACLALNLW